MHQNIFLSVIIPVYNAKNYLPFCLDSILATGREDIEIVLVDDGSTDGSAALCTEYQIKHSNIIYLHQTNSGPSAARNKGLEKANGKYVAFVDADDYINPEALNCHLEQMEDKSFDIWASNFLRVADNGCVLDEVCQIKKTDLPVVDGNYFSEFLAAPDCVWNVWRYIYRRGFLDENGLRFAEGYNIAEDLYFVVRAFLCCKKVFFFHKAYYCYRVNYSDSLTRVYDPDKIHQLLTMLKHANGLLGHTEKEILLKAKIAREYLLNLSVLYDVTKKDRVKVLLDLKDAKTLMSGTLGFNAVVAFATKVVGIPLVGMTMWVLKKLHKRIRENKMRLYIRNGK